MVNGFSKCQSSCFIDLASQRGEQTHLDGISPTAKTAQRVREPNYPEMWSWLCAFVTHNVLPHPISHRSFPHQLDTSQLLPASPVASDLLVSFPWFGSSDPPSPSHLLLHVVLLSGGKTGFARRQGLGSHPHGGRRYSGVRRVIGAASSAVPQTSPSPFPPVRGSLPRQDVCSAKRLCPLHTLVSKLHLSTVDVRGGEPSGERT